MAEGKSRNLCVLCVPFTTLVWKQHCCILREPLLRRVSESCFPAEPLTVLSVCLRKQPVICHTKGVSGSCSTSSQSAGRVASARHGVISRYRQSRWKMEVRNTLLPPLPAHCSHLHISPSSITASHQTTHAAVMKHRFSFTAKEL